VYLYVDIILDPAHQYQNLYKQFVANAQSFPWQLFARFGLRTGVPLFLSVPAGFSPHKFQTLKMPSVKPRRVKESGIFYTSSLIHCIHSICNAHKIGQWILLIVVPANAGVSPVIVLYLLVYSL
jgi:hypothetical protein